MLHVSVLMASNIVLSDAAATPVAHTFVPLGRDPKNVFWFEDQSQANTIGFWRISVEQKRPTQAQSGTQSKDRTYRTIIGLHEPVLEVVSNSTVSGISPAPTVAYIPRVFTEYVAPERSSLLDRKHLRKMNAALQADTQIVAVVENQTYLT